MILTSGNNTWKSVTELIEAELQGYTSQFVAFICRAGKSVLISLRTTSESPHMVPLSKYHIFRGGSSIVIKLCMANWLDKTPEGPKGRLVEHRPVMKWYVRVQQSS
jgi:hypothetical protein